MPRRLIKRYLPDHREIRDHKHLRFLGRLLHDPNLWHLNRRSVAGAFSVGLFVAFLPVPFQMVFAAAAAIPCRVNLPISVALVWLTNPVTMPPVFYAAYTIGTWLLGIPPTEFHFEMSWTWLTRELGTMFAPFILGCLILSASSAVAGNLLVRLLWRIQILKHLRTRRERRRKPRSSDLP